MTSHWGRTRFLIGAAVYTAGCRSAPPPPPPPPAVTVAVVPERDVKEWDEFTGRLEAVDAVEIRPRVSGYIKRVTFAEGKEIRKGEVLFEIDPRPYQLLRDQSEGQLARDESMLKAAKSTFRRFSFSTRFAWMRRLMTVHGSTTDSLVFPEVGFALRSSDAGGSGEISVPISFSCSIRRDASTCGSAAAVR